MGNTASVEWPRTFPLALAPAALLTLRAHSLAGVPTPGAREPLKLWGCIDHPLPCWELIQAATSAARQRVSLGPRMAGEGALPSATSAHQ